MAKTPDWQYQKSQELKYIRQLKKIAAHSAAIVESHINAFGLIDDIDEMMRSSELYSMAIGPWASRVSLAMINTVAKTNEKSWTKNAEILSRGLSALMKTSNISSTIKSLQDENVKYIKSLPTEAAIRAKNLSQEAVADGSRASEVAEQIRNTSEVTKSRATLIARTEIAKTNSSITQARAQLVGADSYIWRTAGDSNVRPAHEEMADKTFQFSNPPVVGNEGAHGPGNYPNCRCYAEIVQTW